MFHLTKKAIKIPVEVFSYMKKRPNGEIVRSCKQVYISGVRTWGSDSWIWSICWILRLWRCLSMPWSKWIRKIQRNWFRLIFGLGFILDRRLTCWISCRLSTDYSRMVILIVILSKRRFYIRRLFRFLFEGHFRSGFSQFLWSRIGFSHFMIPGFFLSSSLFYRRFFFWANGLRWSIRF